MVVERVGPKHEALYQELLDVMGRYDLSPVEILAVLSNMVGKAIAFQDQRTMTPDRAMRIIERNIMIGNNQVVARFKFGETKGNA